MTGEVQQARPKGEYLRTVIVILSWFAISATVILTNKWVMVKSKLFPFPILLTVCSNTVATVWAFFFSRIRRFRPPSVTMAQIRRYVIPIGAVTALELGCSNIALLLLDVSFVTIIKGAAPVFTMMWGLAFGIETFSFPVFGALLTISTGVGLATMGERNTFLLRGFLLQLFSTALAGLRWAQTQILLSGQRPLPLITVILYTSPATAVCLLPIGLAREGARALEHVTMLAPSDRLLLAVLLFGIGTLVFVLLCSEYWLVGCTSSLALSVCAVFKELLTIVGGLVMFNELMTIMNIVGFAICQIGIGAYALLRSRKPTNSDLRVVQEGVEYVGLPMTADDPSDEKLSPHSPR